MKISAINGYKPFYYKNLNKPNNETTEKHISNPASYPQFVKNEFYNINFTGANSNSASMKKFKMMKKRFSPEAESLYMAARAYARLVGSSHVESWHLYAASLLSANQYLNELISGASDYESGDTRRVPFVLQEGITDTSKPFSHKKHLKEFSDIILEHVKTLPDKFMKEEPRRYFFNLPPSEAAVNDMYMAYNALLNARRTDDYTFYDDVLLMNANTSRDKSLVKEVESLLLDLRSAYMVDDSDKKEKNHLSVYDDEADAAWKNVSMNKNAVCIYNTQNLESANHFVSSFVNLINKPDQKYKNIDPEKTDIVVLNKNATFEFLRQYVKDLEKKDNNGRRTVIVANLSALLYNSIGAAGTSELYADDVKIVRGEAGKDLKNSKINFVFTMDSEGYFAQAQNGKLLSNSLRSCASQTIPSLNAGDAVKYLTDESGLKYVENKVKKPVKEDVIRRAVELTAQDEGNYPDKAVRLLADAAEYYTDEEELTIKDVDNYVEKNKAINDSKGANTDLNIIFDTGKTLDDIVGTPMTKEYAKSIVKQIKSGIGVKGFIIYNASGSSYGGGRKNLAEAIAGETQIPMIKINAQQFALKDIDALSQNADFSELKMKKIIATAKAQAQANPNKTAMIFIENFDSFGADPLYGVSSIYEQKAFSQLLEEMERVRKEGNVNLVIMGSMNRPQLLDTNIMKPDKFLNEVVIYAPVDSKERKSVIEYYIDKKALPLAGDKKEQEAIIDYVAKSTMGFTIVDTMHLLDTAKAVAKERGNNEIKREDFTEAFLQITTGIANTAYLPKTFKEIVTTHEAGHALNMIIMKELAEKSGNNRHLPYEFNFITLDPRGYYGGATFFTASEENAEANFETGIADIILSYGGNSAEDIIYGQNGSHGIMKDLTDAEKVAERMVTKMGIGPRTGVRKIPLRPDGSYNVSDEKFTKIEKDIDSFLNTGKKLSDKIITEYRDFLEEFTDRYYEKVGTGDCIIPAEDFIKELKEWRERQSQDKKMRLSKLEHDIQFEMDRTKKGEI